MSLPALSALIPSPDAFIEMSLLGSVAGGGDVALRPAASGESLRIFWKANRTLQEDWTRALAALQADPIPEDFERVGLELFLTDMLTRVWATTWTISDRILGSRDVERVMHNSLNGLSRARREVLLLMVRNWRGPAEERISRLDRFRRRSERWVDLLIAGQAAKYEAWDFAVEADRARDFGEVNWAKQADAANPVSLLVSAGLRVMFGTPWPLDCCRSQPFADLLSAIPATLPPQAFAADGALRPVWDWEG